MDIFFNILIFDRVSCGQVLLSLAGNWLLYDIVATTCGLWFGFDKLSTIFWRPITCQNINSEGQSNKYESNHYPTMHHYV